MSMGVPPAGLSDDDLRRELAHLKAKQGDIVSGGTPDQQANHARRTAELEEEFLRRTPADPEPGERSDRSAEDPLPPSETLPGAGEGPPPQSD